VYGIPYLEEEVPEEQLTEMTTTGSPGRVDPACNVIGVKALCSAFGVPFEAESVQRRFTFLQFCAFVSVVRLLLVPPSLSRPPQRHHGRGLTHRLPLAWRLQVNDWVYGVKRGATSSSGSIDDDIKCAHSSRALAAPPAPTSASCDAPPSRLHSPAAPQPDCAVCSCYGYYPTR